MHLVISNQLESVKEAVDIKQAMFDDMGTEILKYCGGALN